VGQRAQEVKWEAIPVPGSRPTILLVEDGDTDVFMFDRALQKTKQPVDLKVVRDGVEATQYLAGLEVYADRRHHPLPNLVVLDLKLPKKSGFEVLEWRSSVPGMDRIPVIILTSSSEASDIRRAYSMGVASYLVKPVGLASLGEMVKGIVDFSLNPEQKIESFLGRHNLRVRERD
jgi:CheY-like chemotaxis protein